MKKGVFIRTLAILGPIALLQSCHFRQAALVEANIEGGLTADTAYIRYAPLCRTDSAAFDTLVLENGKFSWNPDIDEPVEVQIELGRDRKSYKGRPMAAPLAYSMRFVAQPDEKIRLQAVYEDGFLAYDLAGSYDLAMQSRIRNEVKDAYIAATRLGESLREAMAGGAENADEAYVDSLYDALARFRNQIGDAALDYVRQHPERVHAAYFLLTHPERDTFLTYYPILKEDLRNGRMAERLEAARKTAERMRTIRQNAERLSPGAQAPDFTLLDLKGRPVKLSDYSNRHVVIDFWGTWCQWCVKGIPQMKAAYARHKGKVVFLSIACRDKAERVQAFVEREHIGWINVMNDDFGNDIALMYGVSGFPTKILLEPGLKVKNRYLGEVPEFYQDLDQIK